MNIVEYKFAAQELQRKMVQIEQRNPNYEQSKFWRKYKRQENLIYLKIKQLQEQGEQENGNQPNC